MGWEVHGRTTRRACLMAPVQSLERHTAGSAMRWARSATQGPACHGLACGRRRTSLSGRVGRVAGAEARDLSSRPLARREIVTSFRFRPRAAGTGLKITAATAAPVAAGQPPETLSQSSGDRGKATTMLLPRCTRRGDGTVERRKNCPQPSEPCRPHHQQYLDGALRWYRMHRVDKYISAQCAAAKRSVTTF